jgi:hypothetical protein
MARRGIFFKEYIFMEKSIYYIFSSQIWVGVGIRVSTEVLFLLPAEYGIF